MSSLCACDLFRFCCGASVSPAPDKQTIGRLWGLDEVISGTHPQLTGKDSPGRTEPLSSHPWHAWPALTQHLPGTRDAGYLSPHLLSRFQLSELPITIPHEFPVVRTVVVMTVMVVVAADRFLTMSQALCFCMDYFSSSSERPYEAGIIILICR